LARSLSILPAIVQPRKDELLSSFLYRLAEVNVAKTHTFCKRYFPDQAVWNRDIDKLAPHDMLQTLSEITNQPYENIYKTTLRYYEGLLFDHLNSHGNSKWILPIGIYHRTRRRFGLQFCPQCFIKDSKHPYFRKAWRLSLSVLCCDCGIRLYDQCPFCKNIIAFHRNEVGNKNYNISTPICWCSYCKTDLRKSPQIIPSCSEIVMQKKLTKWMHQGFTDKTDYSHLYFDVLYQINKLLQSKFWRTFEFQKAVHRKLKSEWSQNVQRSDFDTLTVDQRSVLLYKSFWVLENWPSRFIGICENAGASSTVLLKDLNEAPFWYHKVVMDNFFFPNPLQ
jgi:hypothetical protein